MVDSIYNSSLIGLLSSSALLSVASQDLIESFMPVVAYDSGIEDYTDFFSSDEFLTTDSFLASIDSALIGGSDPTSAFVDMMIAQYSFSANLASFETADTLNTSLMDLFV